MSDGTVDLLQGTLDLLILKALTAGPLQRLGPSPKRIQSMFERRAHGETKAPSTRRLYPHGPTADSSPANLACPPKDGGSHFTNSTAGRPTTDGGKRSKPGRRFAARRWRSVIRYA